MYWPFSELREGPKRTKTVHVFRQWFFRHGELREASSCVVRWAAVLAAGSGWACPAGAARGVDLSSLPAGRCITNTARDAFATYVDMSEQTRMEPVAQMSAAEGVYKTQAGVIKAEACVALIVLKLV